jgi:hypothetical protein
MKHHAMRRMERDEISPRILKLDISLRRMLSFKTLPLYPQFSRHFVIWLGGWVGPGKISAPEGNLTATERLNLAVLLAVLLFLVMYPLQVYRSGWGQGTEYRGRLGSPAECILKVPCSTIIPETGNSYCRWKSNETVTWEWMTSAS